MIYLFSTFFIYSISVCLHIWLHRYFVSRGVVTFRTVTIFFVGLLIHAYIVFFLLTSPDSSLMWMAYRWVSVVLLGLLFWLHTIVFTESFYADKGPSRVIREELRKRPMTEKEILSLFSNATLIEKRVYNLQRDGMVKKVRDRWSLTQRGWRVYTCLQTYRNLMRWDSSG